MMERYRLFLLIALGETVVTPGAALATTPIRAASLASGMLALAGTLCLWWLYFRGEPIALRHVARAEDRVYASRMGINGLLVMIAGLIALAAGNALVIDHPSRDTTLALAVMLCGGPALFLVARVWYQWLVLGAAARAQLLTIAALAATAVAVRNAPALVAALAVVAILATLVTGEHLQDIRQPSSYRLGRSE
jgi:low temperature requirement protein LtrA